MLGNLIYIDGWLLGLLPAKGGSESKLLLIVMSLSQRKLRFWEQIFKALKVHSQKVRKLLCFILRFYIISFEK